MRERCRVPSVFSFVHGAANRRPCPAGCIPFCLAWRSHRPPGRAGQHRRGMDRCARLAVGRSADGHPALELRRQRSNERSGSAPGRRSIRRRPARETCLQRGDGLGRKQPAHHVWRTSLAEPSRDSRAACSAPLVCVRASRGNGRPFPPHRVGFIRARTITSRHRPLAPIGMNSSSL